MPACSVSYTVLEMIGTMVLEYTVGEPSCATRGGAPAALFALAALFFGFPLVKGLSLGQNNGLVMLALAVGLFGAVRGRWALAGVGLGVATTLKVSPGLLVIYLLLRGKSEL